MRTNEILNNSKSLINKWNEAIENKYNLDKNYSFETRADIMGALRKLKTSNFHKTKIFKL